MQKFILLFTLILLLSCNSKDKECSSKTTSIVVLAHTIDSGLRGLIVRNLHLGDSSFVSEVVMQIEVYRSLTGEFVRIAGGLDAKTSVLLNGCGKSIGSQLIYDESELSYLVSRLKLIKQKYPNGREQTLVEDLITAIEKDFIDNNKLYSNLSTTSYSEIIINLLVINNKLYTLILERYLFPASD